MFMVQSESAKNVGLAFTKRKSRRSIMSKESKENKLSSKVISGSGLDTPEEGEMRKGGLKLLKSRFSKLYGEEGENIS